MKRLLLISAGALTLVMLVVHVPMFLGSRDGGGGCPFGYGRKTEAGTVARHDPRLRGAAPAGARPALGLSLDRSTRSDVLEWARGHRGTCSETRGTLHCEAVHPDDGQLITSMWLAFDGRGALDAVRTVRRDPHADPIVESFVRVNDELTRIAGPPHRKDGDTSASALAVGALRQAVAEYRFTDYRAVVRATNMGDGFVLTEEYASLVD